MDITEKYREWLRVLDEEVIQEGFGYEPGEFTVFPEHWHPLYVEGLTPLQAWTRALDARCEARREEDLRKTENWKRIQEEDRLAVERWRAANPRTLRKASPMRIYHFYNVGRYDGETEERIICSFGRLREDGTVQPGQSEIMLSSEWPAYQKFIDANGWTNRSC